MRKATKKDLSTVNAKSLRFVDGKRKQVKGATLKDMGGRAIVRMRWDLNADANRDSVFEMEINGEKAYIDLEEFLSYTRLI